MTATDPDGDPLTYVWSNSNPCGQFQQAEPRGPTASWYHPHPPDGNCPAEGTHPGTITVVISDGKVDCTVQYTGGSADADIKDPAADCRPR